MWNSQQPGGAAATHPPGAASEGLSRTEPSYPALVPTGGLQRDKVPFLSGADNTGQGVAAHYGVDVAKSVRRVGKFLGRCYTGGREGQTGS